MPTLFNKLLLRNFLLQEDPKKIKVAAANVLYDLYGVKLPEIYQPQSVVDQITKALNNIKVDKAMLEMTSSHKINHGADKVILAKYGGIDFNSANLNLLIKRDGQGMPLPTSMQNLAQLSQIRGFEPEILSIQPAANLPVLKELQQKLQL